MTITEVLGPEPEPPGRDREQVSSAASMASGAAVSRPIPKVERLPALTGVPIDTVRTDLAA